MAKAITIFALCLLLSPGCTESPTLQPIYIGQIVALAGPNRNAGVQAEQGARLGLDGAPIQGRSVVVLHGKSTADLDAFEAEASRLVVINHAAVVLGGNTPEEVQRLERIHKPVMTPTGYRGQGSSDAVFCMGITPETQARSLARFAMEELHITEIEIVVDESRELALQMAGIFSQALRRGDQQAGPAIVTTRFDKDHKIPPLTADRPILFIGTSSDFRDVNFDGPILYIGIDDQQRVLERKAGFYLATSFAADPQAPETAKFIARYKEAFHEEPADSAALAYDSVRIVVEAIKRTPSLTADQFLQELKNTKDFAGLTGPMSFGPDQVMQRRIYIVHREGTANTLVKRYEP